MKNQLFTRRILLAGYILSLAIICFFTFYTWNSMQKADRESDAVDKALRSLHVLELVLDDMQDIEAGQRGYLISEKKEFLETYYKALNKLDQDSFDLKNLPADTPWRKNNISQLASLISRKAVYSSGIVNLVEKQDPKTDLKKINLDEGKNIMDSIRAIVLSMETTDRGLLKQSNINVKTGADKTAKLFLALTLFSLFFMVLLIFLITHSFKKQTIFENKIAYLASLIEQTSDAIFSTDRNLNILTWNKAAEKMYGYNEQEIKGRNVSLLLKQKMDDDKKEKLLDSLHKQKLDKGEYEMVRKDGTDFFIMTSVSLIRDNKENVTGYVGIHKDITEQKKAQQQVNYLADIVEQAGDAIISADPAFHILSWNKGAELMYGFAKEEAIGKNFYQLLKSRRTDEDRKKITNRLKEAGYVTEELEYDKKNGEQIFVQASYTLLFSTDGQISGCAIVHHDITERKKAEKLLNEFNQELKKQVDEKTAEIKDIFNRVTDAFVAVDTKWHFTYANHKAEQILHFPQGYYSGKNLWELFTGADAETRTAFETAMQKQEYGFLQTYNEGYKIWFEINIYPSSTGLSVYFKDITERKNAELLVQQANERFTIITKATNDIVWDVNLADGSLWWNDKFYAAFGYEKANNMTGKESWEVHLHPDDKERVLSVIDKAIKDTAVKSWNDEYRFRKADGTYLNIYDRGYIMRDEKGIAHRMIGSMTDLTPLVNLREQWNRSEEKYSSMIEQASDGIFIFDMDAKIVDVNTSGCAMLGYSKKEILIMQPEYLIPDGAIPLVKLKNKELQAGKVVVAEQKQKRKDGSIIIADVSCKMLSNRNIMAIARDITEKRKIEEELVKTNARFHIISKATSDIVWDWDLRTNALWWNDNYYSNLGYIKEREITDIAEWYNRIHPDEIKRIKENISKAFQGTDPVWKDEYQYAKVDGTYLNFLDRGYILRNQQGEAYRMIGSMVDMTERLKTQQQVEKEKILSDKLIDSLPGVFYFYDEDGKFIRWNKQFEIVTGYSAEEIATMKPVDFFEGKGQEEIKNAIKRVFEYSLSDAEADFVSKDGSKRPYYFKAILVNYEGKPCLLGTGIDISDRKKAEQELDDSYKAVRKLTGHLQNIREEERTHIAREIHDELGQQLTVLKMDVAWINKKIPGNTEDPVKKKMKELLDMLDGTVKTVRRISSELRPSLLDDLGLVAAIEWQLKEFEKRSGIKTIFDEPGEDIRLPDPVKTGLFRIFQESLTNVARHAGASKVKVTLKHFDDNSVLMIADNGKGFDKNKITDKRTLGILGMKERTSMIGGKYNIVSAPEKGTTVTVTIPLINSFNNH